MRRALSGYWLLVLASLLVVMVAALPQLAFANNAQTSGLGFESVNNVIKLVVWTITAQFFGFLVWVGGGILDYSISTFIIQFGSGFQSWGLGFAVNNLWTVVRDLFNLTFIFALVYIGFRMILDSDDSGAKKAIVNLVIAALLVNFSLFFTKAIIDFTNITATQVANVLYQGRDPTTTGSISGTFMTIMNLPSVLGPSGTAGAAPNAAQASWAYILGTMVLSLIAAFSFIAGAILIGIRFIVLNYFMVISPVMFIGRVFPFLQSWQSGFWSAFLKNAFFAPAFLLMLYFSVYILENLGGLRNNNPGLEATLNGVQPNVNALAIFLLAGGFLIGSVLLAQKMSVVGGAVAVKMGNQARGKIQGAIGRNTLGRAAQTYDKNLEKKGVSELSWRRSVAMPLAKSKYGGSYNLKEVKDASEKAERTVKEASEKAERTLARETAVSNIKNAISTSVKNPTNSTAKVTMERALAEASNEQISKVLGGAKPGTPEYNAIIAGLSSGQYEAVLKAKDEDINDADKIQIALARQAAITNAIQEKGNLELATKEARDEIKAAALASGATDAEATRMAVAADVSANAKAKAAQMSGLDGWKRAFGKATGEQLKTLGGETIEANAEHLSLSQIDDIKKSKDFTDTEKDRILTRHKSSLLQKFSGLVSAGTPQEILKGLKDEDVAKLYSEILVDKELTRHFTSGMLGEMIRTLKKDERTVIRNAITSAASAPAAGSAAHWLMHSSRGQTF